MCSILKFKTAIKNCHIIIASFIKRSGFMYLVFSYSLFEIPTGQPFFDYAFAIAEISYKFLLYNDYAGSFSYYALCFPAPIMPKIMPA